MIACDQVVSGGSAERTTKMAAAPAADSIYSLPGFLTLCSCFLMSLFLVSRSLSFPVFHTHSLSLIPDYSSFSFPLFQFSSGSFVSVFLSLIVSYALFRRKTPMQVNAQRGEVKGASQDQLMLIPSHISPIIVDH